MNRLADENIVSIELINNLSGLPNVSRFWVAFSGGLDSHVLLHALVLNKQIFKNQKISVCHIDHGLFDHSSHWDKFCREICDEYGVFYCSQQVNVLVGRGESTEAAARDARYAAFSKLIKKNECLVTAHHLNDQVETILLHLLRGSGVEGLTGMSVVSDFMQGWLARPLLGISRQQLQNYANEYKLAWVEDQSNRDLKFDRNYIRHELIPVIQRRWPGFTKTITRSSKHCAVAFETIDSIIATYLENASGKYDGTLSIKKLIKIIDSKGVDFCFYILRKWIKMLKLSPPQAVHLKQLVFNLIYAKIDSTACLKWNNVEIHRYRDDLFAMFALSNINSNKTYSLDLHKDLEMDEGVLRITRVAGSGIDLSLLTNKRISVRFRQGGEKIHPFGMAHRKTLKKLFQENGVPPWIRNRLPLLFVESDLAAVIGYWIDFDYAAKQGKPGLQVEFEAQKN